MAVTYEANVVVDNPRIDDRLDKNSRIMHYPEAAGQTFVVGDFVYLVGGKVTKEVVNPASLFGIALEPATGVTDTDISVEVFSKDTVLIISLVDSTNTDGSTGTGYTDPSASDLGGTTVGFQIDPVTGKFVANKNAAATNKIGTIIGYVKPIRLVSRIVAATAPYGSPVYVRLN
jgi:hypothetical protein